MVAGVEARSQHPDKKERDFRNASAAYTLVLRWLFALRLIMFTDFVSVGMVAGVLAQSQHHGKKNSDFRNGSSAYSSFAVIVCSIFDVSTSCVI